MPRPKRSKVAPSAAAPRVKKATKRAQPVESGAQPPKAPFDDLYDLSDSEERVSRSRRHGTKANGNGKAAMGNYDTLDKDMNASSGGEKRKAENHVEQDVNEAQSEILDDIDLSSSSPEVEVGRRERQVTTPAVDGSRFAIGNFKRRARQPSILGQPARGRSSSVESNLAYENGLTSVGRKNRSTFGFGGYGGTQMETSMTGQNIASGSIIQAVDRGTPAVGSALRIGNFKRRAREPNILRTAQKDRQLRLNYDDDDEDDFNPEDESTPLNMSKSRGMTTSSAPSSSNPRKRKLSPVQVPLPDPTLPSTRGSEEQGVITATSPLSEREEESGRSLSPEEVSIPSVEARQMTPEAMSETMAPPNSTSSSSVLSSIEIESPSLPGPIRGRQILRAATPPLRGSDSPISSPPSLTHSPNFRADVTAKAKRNRHPTVPPSAFSTAQLQSLLPRRRRPVHDDPFNLPSSDEEVDTSGLASDDDELSHLNVRAPQRRQNSILSRPPAILKRPTLKPKAAAKPKQAKAKVVYTSRTRATTSDKENEEVDPDDSLAPLPDEPSSEGSQELEKRVGVELKRAARKFAEVDKWEMEFEDVTASSSSPLDAR